MQLTDDEQIVLNSIPETLTLWDPVTLKVDMDDLTFKSICRSLEAKRLVYIKLMETYSDGTKEYAIKKL